MKKRFLTALTIVSFCSISAFAQIQKGSAMVGGSVGFQVSGDYTNVNLSPKLGYFVIDRLAVGALLNVGFRSNNNFNSTFFGLAPFARYYFTDITPVRFFGQGSLGFQFDKNEGRDGNTSSTFGLGIGASYFLNPNVAVDAILGYSSAKFEDNDRFNTVGLTIGVQAFFGGLAK